MVFTGTYEHRIDAKGRLAIPAELRSQIRGPTKSKERESIRLYVTPSEGPWLCLYTEQGFEQRAAELDYSDLESDQLLEYERLLFSLAVRAEVDPQGRIRLPEHLMKMVELKSEVVLLGVKDHVQIRDRESWRTYVQKVLSDRPHLLMNPRRAMRSRPGAKDGPDPGDELGKTPPGAR